MGNKKPVKQARALRKKGWSVSAIAQKLGTKSGTISRWCLEIPSERTRKILDYHQNKRDQFYFEDKLSLKRLSSEKAKIIASLLYWCEGSKYPSSNVLSFTSSDLEMQRLFIFLLRKGFKLNEDKFRVWLQLHSDQDKEKLIDLWSNNLDIPKTQFIKPKITNKNGNRYRTIYYGTCALRYADYSVLLRLMGIYKRFSQEVMNL